MILFAFSDSKPFQFLPEHVWEVLLWHSVSRESLTNKALAGCIHRDEKQGAAPVSLVQTLVGGRKWMSVQLLGERATAWRHGLLSCCLKPWSVFLPFHFKCFFPSFIYPSVHKERQRETHTKTESLLRDRLTSGEDSCQCITALLYKTSRSGDDVSCATWSLTHVFRKINTYFTWTFSTSSLCLFVCWV